VQRRDGVAAVVLAAEERRELETFELRAEIADEPFELGLEVGVRLAGQELVDRERVVEAPLERVVARDIVAEPGELGRQPLRARLVVPQRRVGRLLLELRGPRALAVDVKGTPSRRRRARRALGGVRCGRSSARSSYRARGRDRRHGGSVPAGTAARPMLALRSGRSDQVERRKGGEP
jgi:hypothetical protein